MLRVLAMVAEELSNDATRRQVRDQLVHPMVRLVAEQAMPYLMAAMTIIVAILLMSMLSLGLSFMFYFRRPNAR